MSESIEEIFELVKVALASSDKKSAKISFDKESGIIRIFSPDCTLTDLALSAVSEALEVAYAFAEHHPYWAILYHSSEICRTVLESWDLQLPKAQLEEIAWRSDEIKSTVQRLSQD